MHSLDQTQEAGEITLKYLDKLSTNLLHKDTLDMLNTNIAVTKANLKELGGQRTAVDPLDHIIVEQRRKGYERYQHNFYRN